MSKAAFRTVGFEKLLLQGCEGSRGTTTSFATSCAVSEGLVFLLPSFDFVFPFESWASMASQDQHRGILAQSHDGWEAATATRHGTAPDDVILTQGTKRAGIVLGRTSAWQKVYKDAAVLGAILRRNR